MQKFIIVTLLFTVYSLNAKLVPCNLLTRPHPIQRFTWSEAREHLGGELFDECYGISKVKMRSGNYETWLIAITEMIDGKVVYIEGIDSLGERVGHWVKKCGSRGSGIGQLEFPLGIAIDSVVFESKPDTYYIYVADQGNNRIARYFYSARRETMRLKDYIWEGYLAEPQDVDCLPYPGGGSYLLITDTDNHRIILLRVYDNLSYAPLLVYGDSGNGIGQFRFPTSAKMVPIPESLGFYRIYVVDGSNYRIVSLIGCVPIFVEIHNNTTLTAIL